MRYLGRTTPRLLPAAGLAILLVGAPLAGQDAPPPMQQEALPDSIQEMIQEFQELEQRLGQLQQQALAESQELQERQVELQGLVQQVMQEIDPEFESRIERLQALEREAMAAQEAQDAETLQALIAEAQSLQADLQQTQERAMENPEVQSELEVFQTAMMDEMTKHDPEAPELLERLEELAERLTNSRGAVG
jgi:DNA repair exonuclease SbcCD ATPase subunit